MGVGRLIEVKNNRRTLIGTLIVGHLIGDGCLIGSRLIGVGLSVIFCSSFEKKKGEMQASRVPVSFVGRSTLWKKK